VECAFEEDVKTNYPMFLKAFTPNFPSGYTTAVAVKKYLSWDDLTEGMLRVPYMIFIDAGGTIRGDFSGKDGFFGDADRRIRAELDKMTKTAAKQTAQKK
jgi:hypothetical protein